MLLHDDIIFLMVPTAENKCFAVKLKFRLVLDESGYSYKIQ